MNSYGSRIASLSLIRSLLLWRIETPEDPGQKGGGGPQEIDSTSRARYVCV